MDAHDTANDTEPRTISARHVRIGATEEWPKQQALLLFPYTGTVISNAES